MVRAAQHFDVTVWPDGPLSCDDARQAMADYDVILPTLGDDFSASAFQGLDAKCKILANFGVGYNHIDAAAARAAGIAVTNTPGAVTDATADIALTLMLMTCRRAGEGERHLRAGHWTGWTPTQLLGLHMSGKSVAIIGMGRIGQAIAQRCRLGFGMSVTYYNRTEKSIEGCVQVATLEQLVSGADIVVTAVPGGAETRHLINVDVFTAMQPHAIFVNIARGDVVDEAALITALENGEIGGAGLDVYENEPEVPAALTSMENVTLLPHLGTAALEVRTAMGMMAVDNLVAFTNGETLPNPV